MRSARVTWTTAKASASLQARAVDDDAVASIPPIPPSPPPSPLSFSSSDNDYEGGVWVAGQMTVSAAACCCTSAPAGEFYAEGPKHKKRKQSKESQIYGIWCPPPSAPFST